MTKPDKSSLIRESEDNLRKEDYSYHHEANSAFLIGVMASVHKMHLSAMITFSDLVSKFAKNKRIYHQHGRCDFILLMFTMTLDL